MALTSFVCSNRTRNSTCKAGTHTRFLPFQCFERLDDILRVPPKEIYLDENKGRKERHISGKPSLYLHILKTIKTEGEGVGHVGDIRDLPQKNSTSLSSSQVTVPFPGGDRVQSKAVRIRVRPPAVGQGLGSDSYLSSALLTCFYYPLTVTSPVDRSQMVNALSEVQN